MRIVTLAKAWARVFLYLCIYGGCWCLSAFHAIRRAALGCSCGQAHSRTKQTNAIIRISFSCFCAPFYHFYALSLCLHFINHSGKFIAGTTVNCLSGLGFGLGVLSVTQNLSPNHFCTHPRKLDYAMHKERA